MLCNEPFKFLLLHIVCRIVGTVLCIHIYGGNAGTEACGDTEPISSEITSVLGLRWISLPVKGRRTSDKTESVVW